MPALGSRGVLARVVVALFGTAAVLGLAALGHWQLGRAAEKRALAAEFAAGDAPAVPLPAPGVRHLRYTRVEATGQYLPGRQFLLDNMTHGGQAGYRVLTPMLTRSGEVLLVDRGWLPLGATRAVLPDVGVAGSERTVSGRLDALPRAGLHPQAAPESGWPRRISYPTHAEIEQALGTPVYDELLLLDANRPDGYVRDWQPPGPTAERHLGYALQWFALALTLAVLLVAALFQSRESRE